jgi:hypothetical protein
MDSVRYRAWHACRLGVGIGFGFGFGFGFGLGLGLGLGFMLGLGLDGMPAGSQRLYPDTSCRRLVKG